MLSVLLIFANAASDTALEDLTAQVAGLEAKLEAASADSVTAMTHMWLILCGALVMFMHAGFAMVESGCCRDKNVQSVLAKNLLNCCVGTVGWWLLGYGIAYGDKPDGGFAGSSGFANSGFLERTGEGLASVDDQNLAWFFQWAFCMTSATIVSGAVAERLQLGGYVVFAAAMTTVTYPVIVAWTWACAEGSAGWLNFVGAGYMDFAGSGIVHLTGGIGALVGAAVVGRRSGRFDANVDQEEFAPHNIAYVVLGTIILWFGWYGFNCGSTLAMDADAGRLAAQIAVNTTLAPAVAGLVAVGWHRLRSGRWNVVALCCGVLAGLVSITAGCGNVEAHAAAIIGAIGGFVYLLAAHVVQQRLRVDDPVDAFAVHGACGFWGVLAAALFDWGGPDGAYHAWGGFARTEGATIADGLLANFVGGIVIMLWSGSVLAAVFLLLRRFGFLRVDEAHEDAGLDDAKFCPKAAYNVSTTSKDASTSEGSTPTPSFSSQELASLAAAEAVV